MKKLTIEHMHAMAKSRGGRCLSNNYINSISKLKWECNNNHIWEAVYGNIQQGQ
jgi:hypothetical protein